MASLNARSHSYKDFIQGLAATSTLDIVQPNSTVCNIAEISPGIDKSYMHRTRSLDYGIVLVGEIELTLDSGEMRILNVGDVVVQRAKMHAWQNTNETEWARVFFMVMGCENVAVWAEGVEPGSGHRRKILKSVTSNV